MSALDALDRAIAGGLFLSVDRKPGEIIKRMPADVREALAGLTADDLARLRPGLLIGEPKRRGRFNR